MHQHLSNQFEKLEANRKSLLDKLLQMPLESLYYSPAVGKWSAIQIIEHLRIAEKQTLHAIQKNLETRTFFKKIGLQQKLNALLTQIVFRSRIKQKAPSFVANIAERPDLNHSLTDWEETRQGFKTLIANYPVDMADKLVFKHPVIGLMTLSQTLSFFELHFDTHQRQVLRLINR